jgi:broad specificity phosphatase PhoE
VIEVCFIRHGQSESNAGLASDEPAQIPLTALGRAQALELARALPAPALVVRSPYLRAQQTAEALLARHPTAPVEDWPVQEFTYLSPARYRQSTQAQRAPHVQAYWQRADPHHQDGDGAESFFAFNARVEAALARLRNETRSPVLVFGHGQFLQRLMFVLVTGRTSAGADEMGRFRQFMLSAPVANTAVLPLRLGDGDWIGTLHTRHLPPELLSY